MLWRWCEEMQPGNPWQNMAEDTRLLESLRDEQSTTPIIRIYQWDRPAISFGRLQAEAKIIQRYPHLPCVRRPTGGRAVRHGGDLTIAILTRMEWLPEIGRESILGSYRLMLAGIITALQGVGISAGYGSMREARSSKHIINCFDLAAGCDLIDLHTGNKILGSAQRRDGRAILQQMSLPLASLPDLPEFTQALRSAFQTSLQIEGWLTIDTPGTVWYTENEESEGLTHGA